MIKIRKSAEKPAELSKAYNHSNVCRQIMSDQDNKCYLCEIIPLTDHRVDHFIPQEKASHLEKDWNNLLITCDYCNRKKWHIFDNILNPLIHPIEDVIYHTNDFVAKKALFIPKDHSPEVLQTTKLLSSIFNGKGPIREFREERFYENYLQKINRFLNIVNEYLSNGKPEYKEAIKEELHIKSELLGFKYVIINDVPELKKEFGALTVWNKVTERLS